MEFSRRVGDALGLRYFSHVSKYVYATCMPMRAQYVQNMPCECTHVCAYVYIRPNAVINAVPMTCVYSPTHKST